MEEYRVTKEIHLDNKQFQEFSSNLLDYQDWCTSADGGHSMDGVLSCIRVVNDETGGKVLVNNEGFRYPRYTAIEPLEDGSNPLYEERKGDFLEYMIRLKVQELFHAVRTNSGNSKEIADSLERIVSGARHDSGNGPSQDSSSIFTEL